MKTELLSKVETCILLTGETGTGKTTLAKEIHIKSPRKDRPFIRINLASLSSSLIESELFGHTKGAFTGAISEKRGLLESIQGGTLFLDEISELDLSSQKKLLDVIELRTFRRIGSLNEQHFNGTIILASNKNLENEVKNKAFREDLYYRIRVFEQNISPLKDNKFIVGCILSTLSERDPHIKVSKEALRLLLGYKWPGNYRELKNSIEYILTVLEGDTILPEHLPDWIKVNMKTMLKDNYKNAFEKFEKCLITDKLRQHLGKINETAAALEISKTTLIQKIRKYKIENKEYSKASKKYLEMV